MTVDRLPGLGRGTVRRRRGRNERSIDRVASQLVELGQYDEHHRALATLARTAGAALDRLEDDDDRSDHTVGTVAGVQLRILEALEPAAGLEDAFERLSDELSSAVRDSAQP